MSAELAQLVHVPCVLQTCLLSQSLVGPEVALVSLYKVAIEVQDGAESLTGETIIVNLHGALISTSTHLNIGMRISVYVYLKDKRAKAQVVYLDPGNTNASSSQ